MLRVDVGPMKLGLAFRHPALGGRRKTICTIFKFGADGIPTIISVSETWCSMQDQFNKTLGRKHALARALCNHVFNVKTKRCSKCHGPYLAYKGLKLTKEQRAAIWQAYLDRPRIAGARVVPKPVLLLTAGNQTPVENLQGTYHAGA